MDLLLNKALMRRYLDTGVTSDFILVMNESGKLNSNLARTFTPNDDDLDGSILMNC